MVSLLLWTMVAAERGQIAGTVTDTSGAMVAQAAIAAVNDETGLRRSARSGADGRFVIAALTPGIYKVTARRPGFQTIARLGVMVAAGRETDASFTLTLGNMREVVTIEGTAPAMNTQDASVGNLTRRAELESLPLNGRGLLGVIDLTPGVVATPATNGEAGQFSANGLRANTNYFTVDGVSANTGVAGAGLPAQFVGGSLPGLTAFGSAQSLVSLPAVEEVRIQTSTFAPEYGRMPGAQVAITTRSGTEEWHGSLTHAFRHRTLDANDWFANRLGFGRAPVHLQHGSGALGGPLARQRTFLFATHEHLALTQPVTWRLRVPRADQRSTPLLAAFPAPNRGAEEAAGQLGQPSRLRATSARVDHALTPRFMVFGRYHQAPSSTESGVLSVVRSEFVSRSFTLGLTALPGPAWVNETRVNFSHSAARTEWRLGPGMPAPQSWFVAPPGADWYGLAIGGYGDLIAGRGGRNQQNQINLANTASRTSASHAWRFGAEYQRLTPSRAERAMSAAGYVPSLDALAAGVPPLVSVNTAEQASSLIETFSAFAQDTWRVTGRWTLTYGLRWELTPAPTLRQPVVAAPPLIPLLAVAPPMVTVAAPAGLALWAARYDQFAPRFGSAFRLGEGGVLRAGWGLFYDLGFSAATDPINGMPFNRWQTNFAGPGGIGTAMTPQGGTGFQRGLRLPRAHHWNVALERSGASLTYAGSAGRQLLRREGTLQPALPVAGLVLATNNGASDYHSLQARYRRRLGRRARALVSYTWAHAIDNGSWDSGHMLVQGTAFQRGDDRASASFDVRHSLSAAGSWRWRQWTLQGIFRARTGFPVDVLEARNWLGLGFDNYRRPDLAPGVPVWSGRELNRAAFLAAETGRQGTLGRNAIRGFGLAQWDTSLERTWNRGERMAFELRVQAFNVLNTPSFADPVRFLDAPFFGQSPGMLNRMLGTGTAHSGLTPVFQPGGARSLEIALRWRF